MKNTHARAGAPVAQTRPPEDPDRLHARLDKLRREARTAERYGQWSQSARLHRAAREIERRLEQLQPA